MAQGPSSQDQSPLLLIPGPTPVPDAVLAALARPTVGHGSVAAATDLRRIQSSLLAAVGAEGGDAGYFALVMAGSGTSAMESALVNVVAPGDPLVVVSQGYFGDRFATLGAALGAKVERVACEWGRRVPLEEVEQALERSGAKVLTLTHVDTSNGVAAALPELAELARARGALLVLDAVASLGGMAVEMAGLGIDVVASASQKALAMPPGLGMVVFSQRALEWRRRRATIASYFLDWVNWLPAMADPTSSYFATLPTNLLAAGAVAVDLAESEGWVPRFGRHRRMARAVRRGLRAMGLPTMAGDELLGDTVTALALPPTVDPKALRLAVAEEGVAIATGLGDWSRDCFRVGHMGATSLPQLLTGLAALEQGLRKLGAAPEPGAGVSELLAGWESEA